MPSQHDEIHYIRLSGAKGGRAEMVRLVYALAGRPYVDVLSTVEELRQLSDHPNPFKQLPWVVTPEGETIYQSLAIMHHAAHGTPAWPSDPATLTRALAVGMGGYDLYQHFATFTPSDAAAKEKFEQRRAPQFFRALETIYGERKFAAGETPTFADCIVHEAIDWCVRRNEAAQKLLGDSPNLRAFVERFRAVPAIADFMKKQAAAREADDSV